MTFKLPKGFKVKALPQALAEETPYAAYTGAYEEQDGAIVFTANLERRARVVPAKDYAGYRSFCQSVAKFAQQKMFLLGRKNRKPVSRVGRPAGARATAEMDTQKHLFSCRRPPCSADVPAGGRVTGIRRRRT